MSFHRFSICYQIQNICSSDVCALKMYDGVSHDPHVLQSMTCCRRTWCELPDARFKALTLLSDGHVSFKLNLPPNIKVIAYSWLVLRLFTNV